MGGGPPRGASWAAGGSAMASPALSRRPAAFFHQSTPSHHPTPDKVDGPTRSTSIQFNHQTVLERDATVHACRDVHIVGRDDDRQAGGLHQLGERGEYVLGS